MAADQNARAAPRRPAVVRRALAARRAQDRRFWIGVACAALVHAAILIGVVSSSSQRRIGEPSASPEGIAVELVDAADLESRSTVTADNPPANTGSLAPPPQRPSPEPARPPQEDATPATEPEVQHAPLPAPKNPDAIEKAPEHPTSEPHKKETSKAAPTSKSASLQRPHDPLELSLPDAALAPAGRSAAFARPPNITRSGENDEFGRGVIRALRRTMPGSDRLGQVTIRLLLSETGNLLEAHLVRSGGDPIMDQNVVFAAKQASFPIPPNGATVADRTFLVTYVYR
ncbi:MAG TPA: TonB family protein [Hyphomicrobiaceae bacterium]|jgi:protein TonB|nr:TonB family protein [Hyphomicrobiaceae bacterium]